MTERRLHLLNPSRKLRSAVERCLPLQKPDEAVWIRREHPYHTETVIRWGLQEGFRCFIVWGGDGTLHRTVRNFHELDLWSQASLGLVPVGTCNDWGRHVGLAPGDIAGALEFLRRGRPVRVDVGLATWVDREGKRQAVPFLNNAGFGRSLNAIREGWGPVRNVFDFKPRSLRIEADGKAEEGRFLVGVVCNGPFFSGGLRFSDSTSARDARLDGFFTRETGPWPLLGRLALGRLGRPLLNDGILEMDGAALRVASREDLWIQADGELLSEEAARTVEFSVMPQKLAFHLPT